MSIPDTPAAMAQQIQDAAGALKNLNPNDPDAAHKEAQINTLATSLVRFVSPWVSEKVQLILVAVIGGAVFGFMSYINKTDPPPPQPPANVHVEAPTINVPDAKPTPAPEAKTQHAPLVTYTYAFTIKDLDAAPVWLKTMPPGSVEVHPEGTTWNWQGKLVPLPVQVTWTGGRTTDVKELKR